MRSIVFAVAGILFLSICTAGGDVMAFALKSSAFKDGEMISSHYTCKGEDLSPPLEWDGAPKEAKSFAIICDDPDAPFVTWVHWVIYNIPGDISELPEGIPAEETLPNGAMQGKNDFRKIGYGGPCPPPGEPHRYFFKLYALDTVLEVKPGLKKKELLKAMEGHILGKTTIIGKFKR